LERISRLIKQQELSLILLNEEIAALPDCRHFKRTPYNHISGGILRIVISRFYCSTIREGDTETRKAKMSVNYGRLSGIEPKRGF
jgi:hypothetical protein